MYTLTNGPSKFVAKTRRVHGRHPCIEKIGRHRQTSSENKIDDPPLFNEPRPTFQHTKKLGGSSPIYVEETLISPQHEELVKFVGDSWNMILASNPYDEKSEVENAVLSNGDSKKNLADSNNNNTAETGAYDETFENTASPGEFVQNVTEEASAPVMSEIPSWPAIATLPASAPFIYNEPAHPSLENFKPFDLDNFWSGRLLRQITENT